ncbi:hypothetical protein GCM10023200_54590 [Actinomycetospora chlora]|uniref:Uncharacterized protein n=1 Tax=Actinomycetospora chlora TaxID=663608 RepID=A0ABP9CGB9_9PSEU
MIAYGIVALLLALFYLWAGGLELVHRREGLPPRTGWGDTVPTPVVPRSGRSRSSARSVWCCPRSWAWRRRSPAVGFAVLQVLALAAAWPAPA